MAKTFDPNRVRPGTIEYVRDANGMYTTRVVGLESINSLSLPEISTTAAVTKTDTDTKTATGITGDTLESQTQMAFRAPDPDNEGPLSFEKNLFDLETEERAHKGIFLAFQYPLEIPGVNTNIFLKTSLNAIRKAKGEKELDAIEFLKLVKDKAKELKFDEEKLNRQLNVGFSGGEK